VSTLLDESCLTIYESPSGKQHVEGWFGETICGTYINFGYKQWSYKWKVSLRYLGKVAQNPSHESWCKRCLNTYKDVDVNAD
jgi:hypothetical protein